MGPRLSQGTSGATRHIRKIRRILRLRKIHCHPSHRRQEEARCSLRILREAASYHGTFTPSSIIVGRRQHHAAPNANTNANGKSRHPDIPTKPTRRNRNKEMYAYVLYVYSTGPARMVPVGSFGETKRQKATTHTKKQRQPWRTKRTSPTYARRGRRSWASWDVPRPSYLPVSSEGGGRSFDPYPMLQ